MAERKFKVRLFEVTRLITGVPVPRPLPKPKALPGFDVEARNVDDAIRKTKKRLRVDEKRTINGIASDAEHEDTLIVYIHTIEGEG